MISVLLLTYNHKKYIERSLQSVLLQKSDFEFEVIVLDDCSTDATEFVVRKFIDSNPQVKYTRNLNNIGLVKNYKKGFSLCQGELIFVLEGDDYWTDPNKISTIGGLMKSNPEASMCFHEYDLLDQQNLVKKRSVNTELTGLKYITTQDLIRDSSIIGNYSVCCYRKSFIDLIPDSFWEYNTNDWGLNMLMGTFGKIIYHPEVMSIYRLHNESSWTGISINKKYNYILDIIPYYKSILGDDLNADFEMLNLKIHSLQKGFSNCSMFKNRIKTLLKRKGCA